MEGLLLEAALSGARIILDGSDDSFVIEDQGTLISELRSERPNVTMLPISWGQRLNRPGVGPSLALFRDLPRAERGG